MLLPLLLLILLVTACAPLSKHDSIVGDVGEVVGRALLCPVTLCLSEAGFYNNWKEEQQREHYARWYQSLTPAQQEREDQRQHERSIAATQALGLMHMNRPVLSLPPAPMIQPPVYPPVETSQPRPRTNCRSNVIGNQVYTTCY